MIAAKPTNATGTTRTPFDSDWLTRLPVAAPPPTVSIGTLKGGETTLCQTKAELIQECTVHTLCKSPVSSTSIVDFLQK